MARERPTGPTDQCPQLGVERTQRGLRPWAVFDPERTPRALARSRRVVK